MTPDAIWQQFFSTPGASWDSLFAALDSIAPLTCARNPDGSGHFVRDASGSIVVVPAKRTRKRAGRRQTIAKAA